MNMTTLGFLIFIGAFITIAGVVLPLISETAESAAVGDIEYAIGDRGKLYVMKTPANYVKTLFNLNPESSSVVSELYFYLYADHDVTHYYDGTENNFTIYVDIVNPNSSYSQTENVENFNPSHTWEFADFYLENVNLSWADNYNVVIDVGDDRTIGEGDVYWMFPIVVRASIAGEVGRQSFFDWMLGGVATEVSWFINDLGEGIRGAIGVVVTTVVGEDAGAMMSSFLTNIGRILTMDFGEIPTILRVMLVTPMWIGLGYVMLMIVRSFIPFLGGPPA